MTATVSQGESGSMNIHLTGGGSAAARAAVAGTISNGLQAQNNAINSVNAGAVSVTDIGGQTVNNGGNATQQVEYNKEDVGGDFCDAFDCSSSP